MRKTKTDNTIRVLMVDDHQWVMDGFEKGLTDYGVVVSHKSLSPDNLVQTYETVAPDVLVVDLRFGQNQSVLPYLKALLEVHADAKILLLSQFSDPKIVKKCLEIGVLGCVTKKVTTKELAKAISSVSAKEVYLSPDIAKELTNSLYSKAGDPFGRLSDQERLVATYLANGDTVEEMMEKTGFSRRWVLKTAGDVRTKLKAERGTDILKLAIKWGYAKV